MSRPTHGRAADAGGAGGDGMALTRALSTILGSESPKVARGPSSQDSQPVAAQGPRRSKYGNRKVSLDGYTFDSRAEGTRYVTLRERQRSGEIYGLECHPKYALVVNGQLIGTYKPDFQYMLAATDELVVEDVKSGPTKTEAYGLRRRLMLALYGIAVREVTG